MSQQLPDLRTAPNSFQRGLDADKADLVVENNEQER